MSQFDSLRPVIISQFGPPALACIRSWGRAGCKPGLVQIKEGKKDIRPASRYLAGHMSISRQELDTAQGMQRLSSFLQDFGAAGVTCISEGVACRLHQSREILPSGLDLWLPPEEAIQAVLSKTRQTEIAGKVGLDVLPSFYLQAMDDTTAIPREHFPVCLRPSAPGAAKPSFKARVLSSPEELERFIQGLTLAKPLIAQPFKNLPNLVLHGARSPTGKDFGLQAFFVPCKFQGVTLSMERCEISKDLALKCIRFVQDMGVTGSYHFEFLWDQEQDRTWFLELNARLGGTTAKALACGYDEPALLLKAYNALDDQLQLEDGAHRATVSSKMALGKYFLQNLSSSLDILDYPQRSRASNMLFGLWAMLAYRDEVFSWRDLPGSLALWMSALKGDR
ncbi:MAG: hypothetical protein R6U22_10615 [Desulfohalobiaceae bacterium]